MIDLTQFNQLDNTIAAQLLAPCVAIPSWVSALVAARPYADLATLFTHAQQLTQHWQEAELQQALSAHPRIGEKPVGAQAHAALSRQEQAAVNDHDSQLAAALKAGNARYEARFGRVFLIRAKGRSGEQILQALEQRLTHNDAEEVQATLAQLSEITLLRLEGVVGA